MEQATPAYLAMLEFRKKAKLDETREKIIARNYMYPNKWPEFKPIQDCLAKGMRECYSFDKFGNLTTVTLIGHFDIRKLLSLDLRFK